MNHAELAEFRRIVKTTLTIRRRSGDVRSSRPRRFGDRRFGDDDHDRHSLAVPFRYNRIGLENKVSVKDRLVSIFGVNIDLCMIEQSTEEIIAKNRRSILERVRLAAEKSGRSADSVRIVAVVKFAPAEHVRILAKLGSTDFGENRPQNLQAKIESLADLKVSWHMIGHLQTNKIKMVYPYVKMIHAVDSIKLLEAINVFADRFPTIDPPRVCLQVNTSAEPNKHGPSPEEFLASADAIATPRKIPIVGLMTMAPLAAEGEAARPYFAKLREIRDTIEKRTGLSLPELSMGMSGDFEAAIEEGATLVRIGSAFFEGLEPDQEA
jgi:pyridoxal phosphate enzyme (YggS family)